MIDPQNITNFNRTYAELEEFLIFAICVAGKKATQMAPKVAKLCFATEFPAGVFDHFRVMDRAGKLRWWLEVNKIGNYNIKEPCIREVIKHDVRTVDVATLVSIKGIGPKTARFFILHSRPLQRLACLDTHILGWLRDQGYENVPKQSPSNPKVYDKWEKIFLDECDKRGKLPADFDLEIWRERSNKKKEEDK